MLHVVGFAFFTIILLATGTGLAVMLLAARKKIEAALRLGQPTVQAAAIELSRIRIVRTMSHRRVMPSLRVAA